MSISQKKTHSLLEAIVSTIIGFLVALVIQYLIVWLWQLPLSTGDNLLIVAIFTVASVIRGYGVRRLFNWWHVEQHYKPDPVMDRIAEATICTPKIVLPQERRELHNTPAAIKETMDDWDLTRP